MPTRSTLATSFTRRSGQSVQSAAWIVLAVASCFDCLAGRATAEELGWQPARTWVFAVGVLEWQHADAWPSMPVAKAHRRDVELIAEFRKAGVPDRQVVFLQDQQATLKHIQKAFAAQLLQTRAGDLLIFYYAGHGSRDRRQRAVHFANYDAPSGGTAWPVTSIVNTIDQNFHGERALLLADCCYSGGLADAARKSDSSIVYGCLCSSFSHNSSTGNWTFTESLLQGFRGDPAVDLDRNGRIALGELADYTELQMAFGERQKAVFLCSEGFEKRTLAAARGPHPQRLGERLEVEWKGKWYRGQIIGIPEHGLRVHYIGFDNKWDEVVPESRTRPFRPQQLAPGASVEVRWPEDQHWYPARILRGWQGIYFIHYEGYAPEWDEWVPPAAIRQPQ